MDFTINVDVSMLQLHQRGTLSGFPRYKCASLIKIQFLIKNLILNRFCSIFDANLRNMKTPFFSRPDPGRLRKALILILVAVLIISIAIPGMILSKGNTLFDLMNFGGFTLFFYALLHPWLKASYYAICIAIFLLMLILIIQDPGIFLKMVNAEKLPGHGAEDLAWTIGGIFFAGILAGIIGIIRSSMFNYDDNN